MLLVVLGRIDIRVHFLLSHEGKQLLAEAVAPCGAVESFNHAALCHGRGVRDFQAREGISVPQCRQRYQRVVNAAITACRNLHTRLRYLQQIPLVCPARKAIRKITLHNSQRKCVRLRGQQPPFAQKLLVCGGTGTYGKCGWNGGNPSCGIRLRHGKTERYGVDRLHVRVQRPGAACAVGGFLRCLPGGFPDSRRSGCCSFSALFAAP